MVKSKKSKELIGYIGMILVVGSFVFDPSSSTFSTINLIGAVVSAIYGALIKSKPVLIMNLFIIIFDTLTLMGTPLINIINSLA